MAGTHQSPRQRRRAVHVRVLIVSKPLQIRVLNPVGPDMKFRARQVATSAIATDAAHALRRHAEAMEASMAAPVRAAAMGGDMTAPRGTVRITASVIMGASVLPGNVNANAHTKVLKPSWKMRGGVISCARITAAMTIRIALGEAG